MFESYSYIYLQNIGILLQIVNNAAINVINKCIRKHVKKYIMKCKIHNYRYIL